MGFLRVFRSVSIFLLGALACAQSSSPITGIVVDANHALVPRASVRLLSPDAKEVTRTLSDQRGRFTFDQACSGCSIEIQLEGFETKKESLPLAQQEIVLPVAPVRE